jgi:hypothetical protein
MGQIMSRGDLVHALAEPFMPNSEMEKAHAKTPRRKDAKDRVGLRDWGGSAEALAG